MTVDTAELVDLAERVALEAADLLLDGLDRARATVDTKSTGTDMVTEMDRAAEALIVAGILEERPDDGLLGEEGAERAGTSGVRWVIDPLDGTTNYLYRQAGFGVSVAAEVDGVVRAGAVVDPVHGEVFTATSGGGAFRNGAPIRPSEENRLGHALVATGFSYDPARRTRQAALLARVIGQLRDIRRIGAAAVDLCSVACGRADAYYEHGLQPWDLAAGGLIASEAGVRVGGLDGQPTLGDFVVAAPHALFAPLCAILRDAGAADV